MEQTDERTNKMIYRKPKRIFEDLGTVNPEEAYYVLLDNVTNTKNQDMKTMVDRGRYFSIFAPRQSGKTTFFKRICRELENFLPSLRDLYQDYKEVKQKALYSIGLIGIRNITKLIVGGVSPFNIADQVDLPPFSLKNVRDLYSQYTAETNQPFTEEAVKKIYEETGGQPWLVNRLGTIITVNIKPGTNWIWKEFSLISINISHRSGLGHFIKRRNLMRKPVNFF